MLIFAHRGASGYAPENTLKAMTLAIELGATAIELDIHAVEGEVLVYHDRRLETKTHGQGIIDQQSLEYISQQRLSGEPIPTLWQVMSALPRSTLVNIELKGHNVLVPFLALYPRLISELGYCADKLLISSFNHQFLLECRRQFPRSRIAPLIEGVPLDLCGCATQLQAQSVHLDINFLTDDMLNDAQQRNLDVYAYTVDYADDILALKAKGVKGLFCNYPDRAAAIVAQTTMTASTR
ncbi:glycerophosphodiester phosphodiesterase family protein [Shewanella sp. NIFS-20-20]|uniref:glycerophosphodiester phosphodiesterase n=1 Tax=Shewanella sp. NIFS-20-20 TaxID=2853806 RepID=UPI001C44E103|nr:glycerophosphodiester phosphodiesterase family protein [Shewanella sp. NIFS-20-20]MBV7317533.1 glycerophosphodiester phosphodiesterase [Shewanella sp. NIFS-20-20]